MSGRGRQDFDWAMAARLAVFATLWGVFAPPRDLALGLVLYLACWVVTEETFKAARIWLGLTRARR